MIEYIWDDQTKGLLGWVEDRQDVFRASDQKQVGTCRDGVVYDMHGEKVCHLRLLGETAGSAATPAAFKALLAK